MSISFYRCGFDPVNGKEMVRKEYFRFLEDKDSPPIRTLSKKKLELHDV
jgi:WD repeat-containing protein 45